ncbi:MAG: bifunctional DNA-formamidopyrimidine glycosylase/DNA-(apurinic or apyrimidinic site) lyase [Phototrophicales bacterium]
MPELPEVETVVRNLRKPLIGRHIISMWYDWEKTIHSPAPADFAARITGQMIQAVNRRAKYILCELNHDVLVIHLKMTGRLYVADAGVIHDADRWVHFQLDLDNGKQLRFSDSRKFGKVYLTNNIETITSKLGPEPLDDSFKQDDFLLRIRRYQRTIKSLLLDQTFIAGIGNIYADEALFRAQIHPQRRSDTLTNDEIQRLYGAIRDALNAGIDHEGASINWYRKPDGSKGASQDYLLVYGKTDQPCPQCGVLIKKIRVAQRGTHFCPNCQK